MLKVWMKKDRLAGNYTREESSFVRMDQWRISHGCRPDGYARLLRKFPFLSQEIFGFSTSNILRPSISDTGLLSLVIVIPCRRHCAHAITHCTTRIDGRFILMIVNLWGERSGCGSTGLVFLLFVKSRFIAYAIILGLKVVQINRG